MRQNSPLLLAAILFGTMGDIFWFGAVFFPEEITKFILGFSSSAEYSDLSTEGLSVIRVLIGIMASLIWLVAILLTYLSLNYEDKSRKWIGAGTVAWFLGDSIISYVADFELNIIFNLISFVPIALILYFSKEESLTE
ncbi:MAG: hypothetical protein HeimC2_23070 [Candidatus Heimdallarchaeota archaeon LC_2]|nr:MAG: hypothetical protein HeimC2_23070 [Candidatus Heimdallarchaeota archaeon LC_2]